LTHCDPLARSASGQLGQADAEANHAVFRILQRTGCAIRVDQEKKVRVGPPSPIVCKSPPADDPKQAKAGYYAGAPKIGGPNVELREAQAYNRLFKMML
jgi:hypothetical protein